MSKAITIRTDDALYEKLDALAKKTERSRNYLANEALKQYLLRQTDAKGALSTTPVAEYIEDYSSRFWQEGRYRSVSCVSRGRAHPKFGGRPDSGAVILLDSEVC